ncbi:MAG: multicopper oxidase domain-containing protein [Methylococcus sp.]|nr:multicopper oxidase domain-containing protein [Methylococcus sp.]
MMRLTKYVVAGLALTAASDALADTPGASPTPAPSLVFQDAKGLESGQPLIEIPVIRSHNGRLRATVDMVSAGVEMNPIRYGDVDLYSANAPFPNSTQPGGQQPFTMANAYQIDAYGKHYPATFPGPMLQLKVGETLELSLRNSLAGNIGHASDSLFQTNFHAHGFEGSPMSMSDNIYQSVNDPGTAASPQDMRAQLTIPRKQYPGLDWYHVHLHGQTYPQVYGGLAGLLMLGDALDAWPRYKADGARPLKQHFLTLTTVNIQKIDASGTNYTPSGVDRLLNFGFTTVGTGNIDPTKNWQKRVNGQLNPKIHFRPGETQIWNLAAAGPTGFFSLAVTDGNLQNPWNATLLMLDGNGYNVKPLKMTLAADSARMSNDNSNTLLAAGNRQTLAVTAPTRSGTYYLVDGRNAIGINDNSKYYVLATIEVSGRTVAAPPPVFPPRGLDYILFDTPAEVKRRFEFSIKPDSNAGVYLINGQPFGEANMPQLQVGTIEEWTLVNVTTVNQDGTENKAPHPFHIHQGNFAVTAINGQPIDPRQESPTESLNYVSERDTVTVPTGGTMTVKFKVSDNPGKYVFHCHLLAHEDKGMMSSVLAFGPAEGLRNAFGPASPGQGGPVNVIDGAGKIVAQRYPFGRRFNGGIATSATLGAARFYSSYALGQASGGSKVAVFSGQGEKLVGSFTAFAGDRDRKNQGVSVALGDIAGDGSPEVVVGSRAGGTPEIRIFSAKGKLLHRYSGFLAGEFPHGINVAAGDVDADNFDDVIVGAGAGHAPEVIALSGRDIANHLPNPRVLFSFTAGGGDTAGAQVAVGYVAPATRPSYLANLVTTPETGDATGTVEVWNVYGLMSASAHGGMVMESESFPSSLQRMAAYQPFAGQTTPLQLNTGYLGLPGIPQVFAWSQSGRVAATSFDGDNQPSTQLLNW